MQFKVTRCKPLRKGLLLLAVGAITTTGFTPKSQLPDGAASMAAAPLPETPRCQARLHEQTKPGASSGMAAVRPTGGKPLVKVEIGSQGSDLLGQVLEGLTGTSLSDKGKSELLQALRCFGLEAD